MMIRKITMFDQAAVNALVKQVHEIHTANRPDFYTPKEVPYSKEEFEILIENDNNINILYEGNKTKEVMGICLVTIREKSGAVSLRTAYMEDLCVAEQYRKRGIGTRLFDYAIKEAKKRGAKRMDLMVWDFNQKAKEFYKEKGMVPQRHIYEKIL